MSYFNFGKHGIVDLQESSQEKRPYVSLAGVYTLRKYSAITGQLVGEFEFTNDITNAGLNRFGNAGAIINQCHVGTGTTPPTVSDLTMANRLASAGMDVSARTANVTAARYTRTVFTGQFAAGAVVGNITEVGVGITSGVLTSPPNPASGYLWSRQLIKDLAGNPVALTVLATEFLTVTYELRMYPNLAEVSGAVTLTGGSTYSFTQRAANISDWWIQRSQNTPVGAFVSTYYGSTNAAATASLPGSYTADTPIISSGTLQNTNGAGGLETYAVNSFKRVCTGTYLNTTQGNFASGILAARLDTIYNTSNYYPGVLETHHLVIFNDKIMKTVDNTLNFRTEMVWARKTI